METTKQTKLEASEQQNLLSAYQKKFAELITPHLDKGFNDFLREQYLKSLEQNLAFLISSLAASPNTTPEQELDSVYSETQKAISALPEAAPQGRADSTLIHFLRQKLEPLTMKAYRESSEDPEMIKFDVESNAYHKKEYLKGNVIPFIGIPDKYLPQWYLDIKKQRRYQKLVEASVSDPEAAELLRSTRQQAIDELNSPNK